MAQLKETTVNGNLYVKGALYANKGGIEAGGLTNLKGSIDLEALSDYSINHVVINNEGKIINTYKIYDEGNLGASSKSTLGLVKIGDNISVAEDGTISASKGATPGGSESLPVYIDDDNKTQVITSLKLGTSEQVNTIEITGKTITDSIVKDNLEESDAALKVNGGIIATSGIAADKVYHAVWNDITDAIEVQDNCEVEPGYCYYFNGKEYHKTTEYCQKAIMGIHSDTAGDILGRKGKHKELDISIGGFVLAYVDKEYEPGTPLTSYEDGYLTEMLREDVIQYPERLVGTYWKNELDEYWGDTFDKVKVNGRKWIKIK